MTKSSALVLLLLTLGAVGGGIAHEKYYPAVPSPRSVIGLVLDTSGSVRRNCVGSVGTLRDAMTDLPRGRDSRVFLISLGGSATRYQPQLELDMALPRRAGGPVRGNGDQAVIDALIRKCEELPPADASAIFRAVRIGIAHIETRCAGTDACEARLFVSSDGEEGVADEARRIVAGTKKKGPVVNKLSNDYPGLQIVFCDYVATSQEGAIRMNDALIDSWRTFFTKPESVRFQPYCSGRADPGAVAAAQ